MANRIRNNIIAIVCFGPVALLTLPFGFLVLPVWLTSLANRLTSNPNIHYGPEDTIWDDIVPIVLLFLGILGIVGLLRVVSMANQPSHLRQRSPLTLFLVACGIGGLAIANLVWGAVDPLEDLPRAMASWILPLCGTTYFLWIARNDLFGFNTDSG